MNRLFSNINNQIRQTDYINVTIYFNWLSSPVLRIQWLEMQHNNFYSILVLSIVENNSYVNISFVSKKYVSCFSLVYPSNINTVDGA